MTEQIALVKKGVYAEVRPRLFGDVSKYKVTFKPSSNPHVFVSIRPGREIEYGLDVVERIAPKVPEVTFHVYGVGEPNKKGNITYHGVVSEEEFDRQIKKHHCGLRLNEFDGFSEVTAKSILHGQYPITRISYPEMWCYSGDEEVLVQLLRSLKYMTEPNPARDYWYNELSKPL